MACRWACLGASECPHAQMSHCLPASQQQDGSEWTTNCSVCPCTQEFENAEGEEYQADLSALASPSSQNGPEVYILPLTEVSLPVSKQPGRSSKKAHKTDAASLTHTCFELQ